METYTIINLLIFLKNQQKDEYRGIEALFEILEDQRIPPEDKMPIALAIFHQLGLEEEYDERLLQTGVTGLPNSGESIKCYMPYKMDCLRIPILNCVIPYDCILN